jgi:hypothetical protein
MNALSLALADDDTQRLYEERPEVMLALAELESNPAKPSAVTVIDSNGKEILRVKRKRVSASEVLGPPSRMRVRNESTKERMVRRFAEAKAEISNILLRLENAAPYARDGMIRQLLKRLAEARHIMRRLSPSENG